MPVARLTGGNATLTDCLAICCLTGELLHVGCHGTLHSGVVGSGVVEKEHAVVLFDHALSIGDLVGSGENGGQCLRRSTGHDGDASQPASGSGSNPSQRTRTDTSSEGVYSSHRRRRGWHVSVGRCS